MDLKIELELPKKGFKKGLPEKVPNNRTFQELPKKGPKGRASLKRTLKKAIPSEDLKIELPKKGP
ncbi:hypothetical protein BpHYR1_029828 [Brachionus plicatilis]|uniref:Uncharacterized protein n=1 Tax=Brachionus plicatilis TaxID=10195 RepID=A0A3M7R0G3_BRAPC|nr:hypothetical protein BpHYR1_029828 [Brachionus plicatilis]